MKFKNSIICLVLLFVAACSLQKSLYKNDTTIKELRENVTSTVSNWDSVLSVADLRYEDTKSYIPESGIRGRYEQYKKYLGISILESVVGEKVFLSGPHSTTLNYKSPDKFGRYNPLFVKKLGENLKYLFKNKTFVKNVQSHYDTNLKNYLRVYYLSYDVAVNNKEVMDGYLDAIANPEKHDYMNGRIKGPSFYLQESFRDFAEDIEKDGYDVYEGFTCPAFWVRRSIDVTAAEFYEVLKLTLKTFDPGFMSAQ